ncbi:MAG: AAA family ATPase [Polyangiaceae bacterium]|nr:AAA family ATPase [Polyangiaceae bacterium]
MTTKTESEARSAAKDPPRIIALHAENYRALRKVQLNELTPLTVLLGPNGSGKSTILDALSFLSECFRHGIGPVWDSRGGGDEIRTKGQRGPIAFTVAYREVPKGPVLTFHLAIDEDQGVPIVVEEWLARTRSVAIEKPRQGLLLDRKTKREGYVSSGRGRGQGGERVSFRLVSPDQIAASTLGQLADNPHLAALCGIIRDWYVSDLAINETRGLPEVGIKRRLSRAGHNLPNVVQYLERHHPDRLELIVNKLRSRVPRLERLLSESMPDGRPRLRIKDVTFEDPVLLRYASDGTLKLLAFLIVLHDPLISYITGIEEPEHFVHHRLLIELAEECRAAAANSQFFLTTHSPYFVNGFQLHEVRILYRDEYGHTQAVRGDEIRAIREFSDAGASIGELWSEGHFGVGDPLVHGGSPAYQWGRGT